MNLASRYDRLTPEERFRLLMAATTRGDDAERARLARTGGRITFATAAHSPYAHAFAELAMITFIELVDDAAHLRNAVDHAAHLVANMDDACESQDPALRTAIADVRAFSYILRAKFDGWARFCHAWNVDPLAPWRPLAGIARLECDLELAATFAFSADAMHAWCEAFTGRPNELTLTPERAAAENESVFRQRVTCWGG